MKLRSVWSKNGVIYGGLALWGVLLVSCLTVERTMVIPPRIAGATFVGSAECADCHEDTVHNFAGATHARLMAPGENDKMIGCESCHGPGSIHVQSGGDFQTIVNPSRSPETCFQCHMDKRGEFALANSHPVINGQVTCTDCHEPHKGDAIRGGGVRAVLTSNDTCLQCHSAQAGPFVFEHEAVREGCTTCHNPHGTVNDKMLKARNQSLCLQCHHQQQTTSGALLIGGRDHRAFVNRGACWTAGCHEAVHGSHVNSSLRF